MLAELAGSKRKISDVQASAEDSYLFNEPDMDDTIVKGPAGELLGATAVKTVDYVTRQNPRGPAAQREMAEALVHAYRLYTTPEDFLGKVCTRFFTALENVEAVQTACIELLEFLVNSNFRLDFGPRPALINSLQSFLLRVCMAGSAVPPQVCDRAMKVSQLAKLFAAQLRLGPGSFAPEAYARTPDTTAAAFLGVPFQEFVKQLTCIQAGQLALVSTGELLSEAWRDPAKAPGLAKYLAWETSFRRALLAMVVTAKRDGDRKKLLLRYSEIAEEAYNIGNFAGFVIFYQVLTAPEIAGHKKLFEKKALKRLETFDTYAAGNFAAIAQAQKTRSPCIPYVQLWIDDVGHMEKEAPHTYGTNPAMWNWAKIHKCGTALKPGATFLQAAGFKIEDKRQIVALIFAIRTSVSAEEITKMAAALK